MATVPNRRPPGRLGYCRRSPPAAGEESQRATAGSAPSTYVVCALDRAIDPGLQPKMAARCTGVREWQTGHCPFVGRPDLIVELLQELLAAGTRAGDDGATTTR